MALPKQDGLSSRKAEEILDRLRELQESRSGNPVNGNPKIPLIDPTANVLLLVEAAIRRQDDLRLAEAKRTDDLRVQKDLHDKVMSELNEKITAAETKRIDAIRAVDVAAVAVASERAGQQATVLANQVATSADTLRALVTSTAATIAQQFQQVTTSVTERLSILERSQYETKGGIGTPPIWASDLITTVRGLQTGSSRSEGRSEGIQKLVGWILAAATLGGVLARFVFK